MIFVKKNKSKKFQQIFCFIIKAKKLLNARKLSTIFMISKFKNFIYIYFLLNYCINTKKFRYKSFSLHLNNQEKYYHTFCMHFQRNKYLVFVNLKLQQFKRYIKNIIYNNLKLFKTVLYFYQKSYTISFVFAKDQNLNIFYCF